MKAVLFLSFCVTVSYCRVFSNDIWYHIEKNENKNEFQISRESVDTLDVSNEGKHWALIVAGSAEWYNYRHQADACHAYHVVQKHGIPAENIVLMMFDDIAQNEQNPTPGIVINHPDGDDVYGGVKIDYRREDVTPDNFLAVMRGDKEAMSQIGSGRVIDSGPNDHVFVNFVDHGAPGILGFPTDMLHVKPFMQTIEDMHDQNKFKQLVFYIEACESGSMFDKLLPADINVWATTAANPNESSYACYFDKERKTYLGDVYSVKWMEDSDVEDLSKETLHKQFKIVKKETNTSHVMQYGDTSIAKESVAEFQGGTSYVAPEPYYLPKRPLNAVPSEEVPMAILHQSLSLVDEEEHAEVMKKMRQLRQHYDHVDSTMRAIVERSLHGNNLLPDYVMSMRHELTQHDCYMQAVDHLHGTCMKISNDGYAMKQLYMLVNLCEEGVSGDTIATAIDETCQPEPVEYQP